MNYFTERENGEKPATNNEISVDCWNAIVVIIKMFQTNNYFSRDFPQNCYDNRGIFGFDEMLFNDKVKAIIPRISVPLRKEDKTKSVFDDETWQTTKIENKIDTYATLDFIEFCYKHICDADYRGDHHEYFKYRYLKFKDSDNGKKKFQEEINTLFRRNGIGYQLDVKGQINRIIEKEFVSIVMQRFTTKDIELNNLLEEATKRMLLPRTADRTIGLEKLWDAFERIKTYHTSDSIDKKTSAEKIIMMAANGNAILEKSLNEEAGILTKIGNTLRIRHHERYVTDITDPSHIDYLFFRLFTLINLYLKVID